MDHPPTIDVAQRRARLAHRHRLAPAARADDDLASIADSVVALHATDPATVHLSATARMARPDLTAVERALYDDRVALRLLAMRRTLFTASRHVAALLQHGAAPRIAAQERVRLENDVAAAGIAEDPAGWLRAAGEKALAVLAERGEAHTADLASAVPALGERLVTAPGKRYESTVSVASRLLVVLAAEGHLARGRPRGGRFSSQHPWVPMTDWLGEPLAAVPPEEAAAEIVRRWLDRFGPGTVADLRWWTGWPLRDVRAALARIDTEVVDIDGDEGLVLAGDAEPVPAAEPWVALLPGLDATVMGWKQRAWYLGDHSARLFDTAGNAGPTVWADGRVVGGWAQRADGTVAVQLLEDVGRDAARRIDEAATQLTELLRDARAQVRGRFRSPLERELAP